MGLGRETKRGRDGCREREVEEVGERWREIEVEVEREVKVEREVEVEKEKGGRARNVPHFHPRSPQIPWPSPPLLSLTLHPAPHS